MDFSRAAREPISRMWVSIVPSWVGHRRGVGAREIWTATVRQTLAAWYVCGLNTEGAWLRCPGRGGCTYQVDLRIVPYVYDAPKGFWSGETRVCIAVELVSQWDADLSSGSTLNVLLSVPFSVRRMILARTGYQISAACARKWEGPLDVKKQLICRCWSSDLAQITQHSSLLLFHTTYPSSTNPIFAAMSTIQRASPADFRVPHEEITPFDLGDIVDYLKEIPSLFDIHQANDVFCDPKNGR